MVFLELHFQLVSIATKKIEMEKQFNLGVAESRSSHLQYLQFFSCCLRIFVNKHLLWKNLKTEWVSMSKWHDIVALRICRKLFLVLKISCFPACTCRGEKGNSWQTKENQARPLSGKLCFQEWLIHKDEAVFNEHHSLFLAFQHFSFQSLLLRIVLWYRVLYKASKALF